MAVAVAGSLAAGERVSYAEDVPFSKLILDLAYQRDLVPFQINRIVNNFSHKKLGRLQTSKRANGDLAIFEGQQRFFSLRILNMGDENRQKAMELLKKVKDDAQLRRELLALPVVGANNLFVECEVYEGLTDQEEAALFYERPTQSSKLGSIALYKSRLHAKEPIALRVQHALDERGLVVDFSKSPDPTKFRAVDKAIQLEGYQVGRFGFCVDILTTSFPNEKALQGDTLLGLHTFLKKWEKDKRYRRETLISALKEIDHSVLLKKASKYMAESNKFTAISLALKNIYNLKATPYYRLGKKVRKGVVDEEGGEDS